MWHGKEVPNDLLDEPLPCGIFIDLSQQVAFSVTKSKIKKYTNNRRHAIVMRIKVGDKVQCKQEKRNNMTTLFNII